MLRLMTANAREAPIVSAAGEAGAPDRSSEEIAVPDDDATLAARIVAGDEQACELLMRRHNQRMFRVARSILGDSAEAEDVLQDAYLRAFRAMPRFEGRSRLSTWLLHIVVNAARTRARRNGRLEGLESVTDDDGQVADSRAWLSEGRQDPERTAGSRELRALLSDAVARLPESLRTVFVLRCVEGMDVAETADSLDLSHEAVRVRLHRARAMLRGDLDATIDRESRDLYAFGNEHCDRLVAAVLARLRETA